MPPASPPTAAEPTSSAPEDDEPVTVAEPATTEEEEDAEEEELDDGYEEEPSAGDGRWQKLPPHPLAELSTKKLLTRMREDFASLGPMSLGRIHGGALLNAVKMPENEAWIIRQENAAWGTQETVDAIAHCITKVNERFDETPPLYIGHVSRKKGGRFRPHVSHQNGRDVDLAYYYKNDDSWYTYATAKNLDRARSWALVRCFITDTDVELILINHSVQRLLREHAEEIGEDDHWLDQVFGGKTSTLRPLIRHARGHGTHIHVRFFSPVARETGRLLYPLLVKSKAIRPPVRYIRHRARKGHTVSYMARRYGVSRRSIRRANRIRRNFIREGRVYRIPRKTGVANVTSDEPIKIPHRRLPPFDPSASSPVESGAAGQKSSAAP